jgi:hypothetical protein
MHFNILSWNSMETSPFNQSLLDARGRREIADTRNPREGAEFPNYWLRS